jgi:hypothetical protein
MNTQEDGILCPSSCTFNRHAINGGFTIFQAELYGISMAMKWIESQKRSIPACAINVDSKAALLSIANKQTTHPLATVIREKKFMKHFISISSADY